MTTVHDVARRAGVSIATVSRVFGHPDAVAAATRQRVLSAAGELGCEEQLGHVTTILDEGSGADRQRQVHTERGMDGLLDYLVTETARISSLA